jgi:type I restriction enzyme, S subunit
MVTLKSYPQYKDSGLSWLGEIPTHWRSLPIRPFTQPKTERGQPDLPLLSVYRDFGVIQRDSRDDNYNPKGEDLSTYKVVAQAISSSTR